SGDISIGTFYADPNSTHGAGVTISGDANNFSGGNTQELFRAGSPLHTSTNCGGKHPPIDPCVEEVYLQLGATSLPAGQLFAPDGTSLRVASPPSGNGQTSASATGGGGALFGSISEPTATVHINPSAKAHISANTGSGMIGGDLWVMSVIGTNVSANTENGSGGIVA